MTPPSTNREADGLLPPPADESEQAILDTDDDGEAEADVRSGETHGDLDELAASTGLTILAHILEAETSTTANAEAKEVDRRTEVYGLERDSETYEVKVTCSLTREDYKRTARPEDWALLEKQVESMVGKTVVFVGSTFEGGGVAMIRPPLVHLLKLMGVNAHWYVMEPDNAAFDVTKKMHNLQQDVLPAGETFTDEDKLIHTQFGLRNFAHLWQQETFRTADDYVIDDPQPAAMIPELRRLNPAARIEFRNHIQTDRDKMAIPNSPQNVIYEYLRDDCGVGLVDSYITHPVEDFVPFGTPNVAYLPPTSDEYEDLNRELSDEEILAGLDFIDSNITLQNAEQRIRRGSPVNDQESLDRNRPRITLFARFDLAKGMPIGMEMGKRIALKLLARGGSEEQIPELVIAGNGSVDDKDRERVLNQMLDLRIQEYGDFSKYIKVIGLQHNYTAVNALIRSSMYTTNPSLREGFEHRATESIIKKVPAIVSNRGGLPLQVTDGESGYVLDLDNLDTDLDRVVDSIVDGILNPEVYAALQERTAQRAEAFNKREISTVANGIRWLRVFNGEGDREWLISDMIRDAEEYANSQTLQPS